MNKEPKSVQLTEGPEAQRRSLQVEMDEKEEGTIEDQHFLVTFITSDNRQDYSILKTKKMSDYQSQKSQKSEGSKYYDFLNEPINIVSNQESKDKGMGDVLMEIKEQ